MLFDDKIHNKIANFYVAPIHSWGNDAHEKAAEMETFSSWEIDWCVQRLELGFNQLQILPNRKKRLCSALEKAAYLISPSGEVYGCTEVSLVPSYETTGENIHKIGHVNEYSKENLIPNINKFSTFYQNVKNEKYDCHQCEMLPICGGFCPKEWEEGRAACPSTKFNIKERMILEFMRSKNYLAKSRE
jgi:uncharacterized protein